MNELATKKLQKLELKRLANSVKAALQAERGDIESQECLIPIKEKLRSGAIENGLSETAAEEFANKTLAQAIEDFKNPVQR